MKRARSLIPEIACFDNLHLAYYKAKKGKEHKLPVIAYGKNLKANLADLKCRLLSGKVNVGNYHYFTIYDPKQRQICAAAFSERVLHHALMNVCHEYFERYQIYDSYATRPNKGTYKALQRASRFQKQFAWYAKFDIRKYFDNIDHHVLFALLQKRFKDTTLLGVFEQIINSYQTIHGKGVPIGNLTSQYFANHYLAALDHFVKDKLRLPGYLRYMDDFVIWNNNKENIKDIRNKVNAYLIEKLKLAPKPVTINHTRQGVSFLSYKVFPEKVYLAKRSRTRFIAKMKNCVDLLEKGIWSQAEFQKHALALNAFVFHADSLYFRKKVLYSLGQ